ncbi:hypothetical protein DFJ77DRAFT_471828 [Powellomyces hirtus]|nr:hypothetical protein DFJ77DRAFT_471828 [Powellomyces hirtus]
MLTITNPSSHMLPSEYLKRGGSHSFGEYVKYLTSAAEALKKVANGSPLSRAESRALDEKLRNIARRRGDKEGFTLAVKQAEDKKARAERRRLLRKGFSMGEKGFTMGSSLAHVLEMEHQGGPSRSMDDVAPLGPRATAMPVFESASSTLGGGPSRTDGRPAKRTRDARDADAGIDNVASLGQQATAMPVLESDGSSRDDLIKRYQNLCRSESLPYHCIVVAGVPPRVSSLAKIFK